MSEIEISVVMPVFNEEASLEKTVDSVLIQEGVNLELIIVDDGSTDSSATILERIAGSDQRVHVIAQKNQGITRALINGCELAKGRLIARQDAGDWSLPGRLKAQLDSLNAQTDSALSSCAVRYFSEDSEQLFEKTLSPEEALKGLRPASLKDIQGPPHHGCVMFERQAYLACGGYRDDFYVAQDLDLWTRLAEAGNHVSLAQVYYEATLRRNAISTSLRALQESSREHIFNCIIERKTKGSDKAYLDRFGHELSRDVALTTHENDAEYFYFIGSLLKQKQDRRRYFKRALALRPLHPKTMLKLILSYFS